MYDAICVGDIFIDKFIEISHASLSCSVDEEKCELCLKYGDKIPVDGLLTCVGGSSSNVAVGLSRLGLKTALVSSVGDDENGKAACMKLEAERVSTKFIKCIPNESNNYSFILSFRGERTILGYHRERIYTLEGFGETRWAYFAFSGKNFEDVTSDLLELIKNKNVLLGYNPSTYELLEGIEKLLKILAQTHILFVNKEEAESLISKGRKNKTENLLRALMEYGPRIVVITDGPKGAYAFDGSTGWFVDAFPGKLIERTGTGDGFAAGFIAALSYGEDIKEALRWGSVNAANVIERVGAQVGLLHKNKMCEILQRNLSYTPVKLRI